MFPIKIDGWLKQKISLVQANWSHHGEFRNGHVKLRSVHDSFHQVSAPHLSHPRFEIASRNILMRMPRLEHRLLANYPFPLYLARFKPCILNVPVPPKQLNGKLALVFNRDPVSKNIMKLPGIRIRRLVFRLQSSGQKYQFFLIFNEKNKSVNRKIRLHAR